MNDILRSNDSDESDGGSLPADTLLRLAATRWLFIAGVARGMKWAFVIAAYWIFLLTSVTGIWGLFFTLLVVGSVYCWVFEYLARMEHKCAGRDPREDGSEKGV